MINMVWQSDVELVINHLAADKQQITDLDYYYQTVDRIEDMRTPDGKQPLTLTALKAWEERCRQGQKAAYYDHDGTTDHHDSTEGPEDRLFPNTQKIIHPRCAGQVHKHPQRSPD